MSRILSFGPVQNFYDGLRSINGLYITAEKVDKFHEGLESELTAYGARITESTSNGNFDVKIPTESGRLEVKKERKKSEFEFEEKGTANIDTSYVLIKHPGRLKDPEPDYLSIKLVLDGVEGVDELVNRIIAYTKQDGALFRLLSDEIIQNKEKVKISPELTLAT